MRKLPSGVDSYVKFGEREKQLLWKLQESKTAVHAALCGRPPHTHTHTHTYIRTSIIFSVGQYPAKYSLLDDVQQNKNIYILYWTISSMIFSARRYPAKYSLPDDVQQNKKNIFCWTISSKIFLSDDVQQNYYLLEDVQQN